MPHIAPNIKARREQSKIQACCCCGSVDTVRDLPDMDMSTVHYFSIPCVPGEVDNHSPYMSKLLVCCIACNGSRRRLRAVHNIDFAHIPDGHWPGGRILVCPDGFRLD